MSLGELLGAGAGITKLLLHLNGDATDASGNSNNGTPAGITYGLASGKLRQGASFVQASSSNIQVPNGLQTPLGDGSYTIGMLLNPLSALPTLWGRGFVSSGGSYYGTTWYFSATNSLQFQRNRGVATQYGVGFSLSIPLVANVWQSVICTFDKTNGNSNVYMNGALSGSGVMSSYPYTVTYNATYDQGFRIGAQMRNTSNTFTTHYMDEVFIDNVVWSGEAVRKFHTLALGRQFSMLG